MEQEKSDAEIDDAVSSMIYQGVSPLDAVDHEAVFRKNDEPTHETVSEQLRTRGTSGED